MKIKETRKEDLLKWLKENEVEKIGDVTKDGKGVVKDISTGQDYGRYIIKVKPINARTDIGAGAGAMLVIHFNNDISKVLENLNKVITEYFEVDSLKEGRMGKKLSSQRALFYYTFIELYASSVTEQRTSLTEQIKEYTGLDRTSYNYFEKLYNDEFHLFDNKIMKKDYVYNHFYILLSKISGKDYSDKLRNKPFFPKPYKSRFVVVIENHKQEVKEMIEKGLGLRDINEKLFGYSNYKILYNRLNQYTPDLFEIFTACKSKRKDLRFNFNQIVDDNLQEIKDLIKEGVPLSYINDKFFFYKTRTTLYRKIRTENKELHKYFSKYLAKRREFKRTQESKEKELTVNR